MLQVVVAGRRPYTIGLYNNVLVEHNRLALIVGCRSRIMNLLFLSTGMVILLAATFLLTFASDTTTVYGCIKSYNANQTNSSLSIGGNVTKPSTFVSSGHITDISDHCRVIPGTDWFILEKRIKEFNNVHPAHNLICTEALNIEIETLNWALHEITVLGNSWALKSVSIHF